MRFRATLSSVVLIGLSTAAPGQSDGQSDRSRDIRLYVLDGGVLDSDPGGYQLASDEVQTSQLSIAAYLVVHPEGVLLWDSLGIADEERIENGEGKIQTIVRPDGQERSVRLGRSLTDQLADSGYRPGDVTHLAFSHLHWDHTANANMFDSASWLVHPAERTFMFEGESGSARPALYAELEDSQTVLIHSDEHDVFGDGSVVLKAAPGHSPGHQVLLVDLESTGPVVLSGDLYHYPEERTLSRLPVAEMDQAQTALSRLQVEQLLQRTGAQLWIGHDLIEHQKLRKAPEYYE